MAVNTALQGILDALGEPRLLIRPDYSVAYANRAFRRRFGIEDFEGRRCHELVFHEFRPCSACGRICPMERAGLSGQPERTIERDFVPGGERFVELEAVPVPAPDGAAVYFMEQVLVRDDPQSVREREGIVMHSAAVQQTVAAIGRVAASDVPVLFCGPSGSGKSRYARLLHENSRRAVHAFIKIDCTTLNDERFESELLGRLNTVGSSRTGGLSASSGGTLYFDEVTALSMGMQRRLLTLLETGFVREAGSEHSVAVGWRVVCATSALNPAALVGAGQLRADLWLRLCVARIRVPALAERIEDIEELAQLILKRLPRAERTALKLSPEGLMVLRRRPWPGNIRELESVLERASLLSDSGEIGPDSLDDPLGGNGLQDVMPKWGETTDNAVSVDGKTRRELARALGISERTLYRRLRERRDNGNGEIL